jgi:hypothetical protein
MNFVIAPHFPKAYGKKLAKVSRGLFVLPGEAGIASY